THGQRNVALQPANTGLTRRTSYDAIRGNSMPVLVGFSVIQVLRVDLNPSVPPAATVCPASQDGRALLERAGGRQPANRRGIDGIGPRHIGHRLARSKPL